MGPGVEVSFYEGQARLGSVQTAGPMLLGAAEKLQFRASAPWTGTQQCSELNNSVTVLAECAS
ncbi:MAG: hypothetical protein HY791_34655 [Deltaproteobacteria bacterium]|nr:hypothetical protein [Deltaproteobacteria bacterium]